MPLTRKPGGDRVLAAPQPDGRKARKRSSKNDTAKQPDSANKKADLVDKPKEAFTASIFSWPPTLPDEFVEKVRELERALDKDIWLILHGGSVSDKLHGRIDFSLLDAFVAQKADLPKPGKVNGSSARKSRMALLIHSFGGAAEPAYRVSTLLQRRCGGFTAIIPRVASSAATLLSLGAESILLGETAELGPLDAQFFDFDVAEEYVSALDEVQAVDALEQSATAMAFRVMLYLHEQTNKTFNVLMPHALRFAADITKPLFEKVDAVRYSRQSRRLQEAQDYAERLLRPRFSEEEAKAIARDLVRNYPTHEFVIDRQEARRVGKMDQRPPVGLQVGKVTVEVDALLDWFNQNVREIRAIGRLKTKTGTG